MRPTDDQRKFGTFNGAVPVYEPAQTSNPTSSTAGATGTTLDAIRRLTPRQRQVLAVMMQGKCNKAICRSLNLAEPTVKNHVTAILKALNATNRTEAVVKFARAVASPSSYTYTISGYSTFLHGSHLLMSAVDVEKYEQLNDQNV
jgi:DNA-binding CsgD family transcriptional regulator